MNLSYVIRVCFVLMFSWASSAYISKTTVIGNITYIVKSADDSKEWRIVPPIKLNKVTFGFLSLNIGTAQILLYEAGRSSPLFSCISCGSTLPPMFTSTTGAVTIVIQGVSGASFLQSSFTLQYFGHIAAGEVVTTASTNFVSFLYMAYGHIKPPLIGGVYLLANTIQQWQISVGAARIRFSVAFFDIEVGCGATLSIYDGLSTSSSLIFQGCSSDAIPNYWLYSTTGNSLIVLAGGPSNAKVDFQIDYIADADLFRCGSLITAPDFLVSNSFSIVDGSKSTNPMRRSESCKWLIQPLRDGPVVLLMNWVSLKQGTKIVVYDSDGPNGVVLWNSEGTFAIVPPPLISSGDSLFVTYTSNTLLAGSFLGFRGDYYSAHSDTPGMGSALEYYAMSSALGITLPDKMSPVLDPSGRVLSRHRKNFSYSFLIKPMSAVGTLVVVFSHIFLSDCGDTLRIFDGESANDPLLGQFCGTDLPFQWVHAASGKAFIEFSSDGDMDRNSSFELNYLADGPNYHCGFPTNPAILTAPSMRITDGSHSTEAMYSNQFCEWIISPPSAESVFVFFDRLDIEGGGELVVYDGTTSAAPELIRVTEAYAAPVPVLSSATNIRITFSTSSDVAKGLGFSLAYFSVNSIFTGPGDGVINLFSSTYNSLTLPLSGVTRKAIVSNYTWHIRPSSPIDSLYVVISRVSIVDCTENLLVFVGGDISQPDNLLAKFGCSGQVYVPMSANNNMSVEVGGRWLELPEGEATVQFTSNAFRPYSPPITTDSFFDLAYFSTGESYSCGLATNPGYLTGASMYFSDGSPQGFSMHLGERCSWVIRSKYAALAGGKIVLEISRNDLRGGAEMWVYDGSDDSAELLWHCRDCTELPHRLISSTSDLYVDFRSPPVSVANNKAVQIGTGFEAVYWSITDEFWRDSSDPVLLLSPQNFEFSSDVVFKPNETSSWQLSLSTDSATLSYFPSYTYDITPFDVAHNDGRSLSTRRKLQPPDSTVQICGILSGASSLSRIVTSTVSLASHQRSTSYVFSTDGVTKLMSIVGDWIGKTYDPTDITPSSNPIVPSRTCQYTLDSGPSRQSISLKIDVFRAETTGRLRVIAGMYGWDDVILDINRQSARKISLQIPCGKATIILDANTTSNYTSTLVDYGFEMTYSLNKGDSGKQCNKYIKSLKKAKKQNNFYQKFFIPLAVLFVAGVCITSVLFVQNRLPKCHFLKRLTKKKKKYTGPAPRPYPKYTPKIDELKNKLLFRGECMVCRVTDQRVIRLQCKHKICLDDLRGYIVAALGDVSMFPLKCPLHIENCTGKIEAVDAKRVLHETQYEKFLEFSDRALYGEGMRCIFCTNFVNYPTNASVAMVECPYCIQRFCIRCKKPWHYGQRCSVETFDDSLEAWTKNTGAQKCPTCSKIIEKDDPSTCHHMVHKITDGIPCTRDRTDFCYLCGLEVTQDYPHDEVKNPGINHFPEGVFQRCRTQMIKERELDREKLRRAKRMKKQQTLRSRSNVTAVAPMLDDDWDNGSIDSARSLPLMGSDPFDVAFGRALQARTPQTYAFDGLEDDEQDAFSTYR